MRGSRGARPALFNKLAFSAFLETEGPLDLLPAFFRSETQRNLVDGNACKVLAKYPTSPPTPTGSGRGGCGPTVRVSGAGLPAEAPDGSSEAPLRGAPWLTRTSPRAIHHSMVQRRVTKVLSHPSDRNTGF